MKFFFFLLLATFLHGKPLIKNEREKKVVLIHGFLNRLSMSSMSSILKKNEWDVENWKYPSRDKTIQEHAGDLVVKLNTITIKDTPIHFVAFSLGGLIVKAALNHPDCPNEAKNGRIILISSPINGSKLARFLGKYGWVRSIFGKGSGQELYDTPKFGFKRLGEFPQTSEVLVISGTFGFNPVFKNSNDGKVSIDESCLSTPHYHEYVRAGHSWICRDMKTINLIYDFLEGTLTKQNCPLKQIL